MQQLKGYRALYAHYIGYFGVYSRLIDNTLVAIRLHDEHIICEGRLALLEYLIGNEVESEVYDRFAAYSEGVVLGDWLALRPIAHRVSQSPIKPVEMPPITRYGLLYKGGEFRLARDSKLLGTDAMQSGIAAGMPHKLYMRANGYKRNAVRTLAIEGDYHVVTDPIEGELRLYKGTECIEVGMLEVADKLDDVGVSDATRSKVWAYIDGIIG